MINGVLVQAILEECSLVYITLLDQCIRLFSCAVSSVSSASCSPFRRFRLFPSRLGTMTLSRGSSGNNFALSEHSETWQPRILEHLGLVV